MNCWPLAMVFVAMGTGAKELYREIWIKGCACVGLGRRQRKSPRGHKNKKSNPAVVKQGSIYILMAANDIFL